MEGDARNMSKVAIGIPCLDMVSTAFFSSILYQQYSQEDSYDYLIEGGSVTYEARNRIAEKALNMGADILVWYDSDMILREDTILRLVQHIKDGKDFVTGLYFRRRPQTHPLILKALDWYEHPQFGAQEIVEVYEDYPRDSLFEIQGAGMGCCAMNVDMFKKIVPTFKCSPFTPLYRLSEDYSFMWRARQCGYDLWCDSSIKPAHWGYHAYTEHDWDRQRKMQNDLDSRD